MFDFDGILFSEKSLWKIKNPRLGILGSSISPEKMHKIFLELKSQDPEIQLLDHFSFDSFDSSTGTGDPELNLLPPDSLIPTASHHLQKKRELFLLSARPYAGLAGVTEHLYENYKNGNGKNDHFTRENPFGGKKILTPSRDEIPDDPVEAKIASLAGVFLNLNGDEEPRFSRIVLYLSELEFLERLDRFLDHYREDLPSGKNTILPIFIGIPRNT